MPKVAAPEFPMLEDLVPELRDLEEAIVAHQEGDDSSLWEFAYEHLDRQLDGRGHLALRRELPQFEEFGLREALICLGSPEWFLDEEPERKRVQTIEAKIWPFESVRTALTRT
ncbi:MAG: hypothetical protein M3N18_03730 [Actinomycetota bacterium]|nr:hypothetical protein [Actinomycetota bacterium]